MPLPSAIRDPVGHRPKEGAAGELVQRLISRGVLPHSVVDYPRYDDTGLSVAKVHVRLLTVTEQDKALANARLYVERLLASSKKDQALDWRPDELEHNARITEVLATACREPDDPSKPFLPGRRAGDARALYSDGTRRPHQRLHQARQPQPSTR